MAKKVTSPRVARKAGKALEQFKFEMPYYR